MPSEVLRRLMPALACCLMVGCARPPQVTPVSGSVSIGGKPAEQILVTFVPESKGGVPQVKSSAVTDGSGRFELRAGDGRDGAVIGPHRVMLEDLRVYYLPRNDSAPSIAQPAPSRIAMKYRAANTTPLRHNVSEGADEARFDLAP
ncbi:MAG: hypothetical protein KF708_17415 [Pirellulales bacterium]|nr:hypothetical protein [Pirellulales bacterium]